MMKRKLLLAICLATLCLSAQVARADLFNFHVDELNTVFTIDTGAFSANKTSLSVGTVTGKAAPAVGTKAYFMWPFGDSGDFSLSMTISNIVSTPGSESADAVGSFTFTDASATADTITGDISGTWSRVGSQNHFSGALGNVLFNNNSGDGAFDGGATLGGSVPMGFTAPIPWNGSIVQITATAPWFGKSSFNVTGGSIDAVVIPTPAAVLLGILGLGVAGWRLRRFA